MCIVCADMSVRIFWVTMVYPKSWKLTRLLLNEPAYDKTYKKACALSEDSDQPGHPPSLIRVFAVRMKKVWVLSYSLSAQRRLWSDRADRRLWSDWADAQADLSLRWAHMPFCSFENVHDVFKHCGCMTNHADKIKLKIPWYGNKVLLPLNGKQCRIR